MAKEIYPRTVLIYSTPNQQEPFISWLESLDSTTQTRIRQRIRRLELGNIGDCKSVGEGVSEMRLSFGSGYRIYFGEHQKTLVILLLGGDKSTQNKDIKKAKEYWADYKEKLKNDET